MDVTQTLILIGAALALCLFSGWRGARPWDPSRGVRMAPWRLLMVLSGAAIFILGIHLANLLGAPQPRI